MAKALPKKNLRVASLAQASAVRDYRLAFISRQASLVGRKEVLTGKAKFGIFGDGKEVAQLALAKAFKPGDWRSGYYRDQTLMFAVGLCNVQQFFAQLYADTDTQHDPMSGGRQMNSHFANRYVDGAGNWLSQLNGPNSAADLSPTAAQMAKLVGLGYASKLYRENKDLSLFKDFSVNGNEVAFGMIGNASAAEGIFWESLNACGVLQVPVAISVWDDGYGISVPNKYQMTKESISEVTRGFHPAPGGVGVDIYVVKGWDYEALVDTYTQGIDKVRKYHKPALFHVTDLTQPQGHSTSGSHERYKSAERLAYEVDHDCIKKMRAWIIEKGLSTASELDQLEKEAILEVEEARQRAWQDFLRPIEADRKKLLAVYERIEETSGQHGLLREARESLSRSPSLLRRVVMASARRSMLQLGGMASDVTEPLSAFIAEKHAEQVPLFTSHLYSETERSPLRVPEVKPVYSQNPSELPGNEVIHRCFDALMARDPRVFIIGEDVGVLGDVNQNFKGLQDKYGEVRITDTGIREATILGQGYGAAIRGLRPVVDIQYLDYLLYCYQLLSDDVATLHYRTSGGQIAPVIVRTKGHRLEGIWHTGSPLGVIVSGLRGMHVCVPRDMVQAAGMYNTLFKGDDPALVIEVLNGYRLKEKVPENLTEFTIPLGVPEILAVGLDVTLVTYGACVRIAEEAMKLLEPLGISVELIDVRTLLPFDTHQVIRSSIEKTNAVLFVDEDVPGGATAYLMQQVLEGQDAYSFLDAAPRTLSGQHNRGAYGSDGDYWCKPSAEDIAEAVLTMMKERAPWRF
jgi:pyruvate/2-oxoglutarate/acetoin dehydrogenase E1 component/TPP-dependent pyruvate/acetoin dehydrogenase alpha subunit